MAFLYQKSGYVVKMCGIFITNIKSLTRDHENLVEECLRFRGPDCSSGFVKHNGWIAYHSRLSIIDINSGVNQPVVDDNGGILVFNGEILNYKELGIKYFNKKYLSDTLLLSDLLSKTQFKLDELDGFFAFVYIDRYGKINKACRDKFGVKPLYFYEDKSKYVFSSEASVLKKMFSCSLSDEALEEYYATRAPIFSGSFFDGIKSIEPGTCLVGGRFFDCKKDLQKSKSDCYNLNEIKEALEKGIQTRMVSDVPVGLLLSKGIDSNLIKELGSFDHYYSIGFEGDKDIEYLKSKNIPNLTIIESTKEEYLRNFHYLLNLRGEPMSVPNEVLLYQVAKKAAEDGVKVLLSGEGADEFFGGYDRIFKWASGAKFFDVESFVKYYCYRAPMKGSTLYNKFEKIFQYSDIDSPFEKVRWFFIKYHMPVLFRRLDFALMAAGIEGREPIANIHVYNVAIKLSSQVLMGDKRGKIPLRALLSEYMGKKFSFEKKVGFPVNLTKIFDNPKNLSSYDLWFKENFKGVE